MTNFQTYFTNELQGITSSEELYNSLQTAIPTSIRVNPNKIVQRLPLDQVAWCKQGYYLPQRPKFTLDLACISLRILPPVVRVRPRYSGTLKFLLLYVQAADEAQWAQAQLQGMSNYAITVAGHYLNITESKPKTEQSNITNL